MWIKEKVLNREIPQPVPHAVLSPTQARKQRKSLQQKQITALEKTVAVQVEDAMTYAADSPFPEPEEALVDLFA